LPDGVVPNTYFSRFIAFERTSPYHTILAKTGMFWLGYLSWDLHEDPLRFGTTKYHGNMNGTMNDPNSSTLFDCPRLHFVTGIVNKVRDNDNDNDNDNNNSEQQEEDDSIIVSSTGPTIVFPDFWKFPNKPLWNSINLISKILMSKIRPHICHTLSPSS
jgi:hypothetical protein